MPEGTAHSLASPNALFAKTEQQDREGQTRHYPELGDAEYDLVQSFIQRLFAAYERRDLEFQVSFDFDEFTAIRQASADKFVYPTYDPAQSNVTPENAFWVKVTNG